MCGRYTLTASAKQLEAELGLRDVPALLPRFNQAPTQPAPIITSADRSSVTNARWGLLPDWARDTSVAAKFVNARSEKALSHATYSALLSRRRCLVPASGFIEWRRDGAVVRPHLLEPRSSEILTMAGLWNRWRSNEGVEVDTFTVFTVAASAEVQTIHDRMPAFLQSAAARTLWLSDSTDVAELAELLQPWFGLKMREVSSRVNSVRNDDAQCLAPPATTQLALF